MKLLLSKYSFFLLVHTVLIISYSYADEFKHFARADQYMKEGKYEQAINEYERAIDINPNSVGAYNNLGSIYQYKLNDSQKAIEVYLEGLRNNPKIYALNLNIMYAYFQKGYIESGIKHYKLLGEIRKDNDKYSFPRKTVHEIIRDMNNEQILDFCEDYLGINPSDVILREILSQVYMEKKDFKRAKAEYKKIMEYGAVQSNVYFSLGVCEYYLGNYDQALKNLNMAKELGEYVPEEYFDMVNEKVIK